jgi:hypothetical protein
MGALMHFKFGFAVVGFMLSAVAANASPVTDTFTFANASGTPTATGSFTYDPTMSGTVLSYADLSAFSISVFGQSYDLSFVQNLESQNISGQDYLYFGFDTLIGNFVPYAVNGYGGPISGILAATDGDGSTGFFIASLPGQADPAGTISDGTTVGYGSRPAVVDFSVTLSINGVPVGGVPESSTWVMLLLGFCSMAWLSYYRSRAGTVR